MKSSFDLWSNLIFSKTNITEYERIQLTHFVMASLSYFYTFCMAVHGTQVLLGFSSFSISAASSGIKTWIESPGSATITNRSQLRHQGEEKHDKNWHAQNKQTNAREAHRPAPSSPSEVITMQKEWRSTRQRAREDFKTWSARSINHKATQNKNNTEPTALEGSKPLNPRFLSSRNN